MYCKKEPIREAYRREKILQAIENYNELVEHLEVVKECYKALRQSEGQRGRGEQKVWWKSPLKDLDLQGLKQKILLSVSRIMRAVISGSHKGTVVALTTALPPLLQQPYPLPIPINPIKRDLRLGATQCLL